MDNVAVSEIISSLLDKDETVIWNGKPNKKGLVLDGVFKMLPIVIVWLALDIAFITVMFAEGVFNENPSLSYIALPFFIIHIAPLWIWMSNILKSTSAYNGFEYVLTQKRIIIKTEVFGIDVRSVLLSEVTEFKIVKDTVDKLLNTGDLIIKGEFTDVALLNIKNVEEVIEDFKKVLDNKEIVVNE